jgi:hypothetical protein
MTWMRGTCRDCGVKIPKSRERCDACRRKKKADMKLDQAVFRWDAAVKRQAVLEQF